MLYPFTAAFRHFHSQRIAPFLPVTWSVQKAKINHHNLFFLMFGAEFQSGSLWYFIYSVHAVLMGCTHLLFWSTCSHLFRPQPVWFIALISLQLLFASFLQLRLKCNLHLPFPTLSSEDSEAMARQPVLSHKHLQPSRISFNEALYMHSLINRKQREEGSREEGKKCNRRTISNVCACRQQSTRLL